MRQPRRALALFLSPLALVAAAWDWLVAVNVGMAVAAGLLMVRATLLLPNRTLTWISEEDPAQAMARQLNQQLEQHTAPAAGTGRRERRL